MAGGIGLCSRQDVGALSALRQSFAERFSRAHWVRVIDSVGSVLRLQLVLCFVLFVLPAASMLRHPRHQRRALLIGSILQEVLQMTYGGLTHYYSTRILIGGCSGGSVAAAARRQLGGRRQKRAHTQKTTKLPVQQPVDQKHGERKAADVSERLPVAFVRNHDAKLLRRAAEHAARAQHGVGHAV